MNPSPTPRPVLFFDLGRVLTNIEYRELYRLLGGGSAGESKRFSRIWEEFVRNEYTAFEKGLLAEEVFFRRIRDAFDLRDVTEDALRAAWNGILTPEPRMLAFAERLAAAGECGMVLVSNTNPSHFRYCLETMPGLSVFDGFVLSYETGSMKPDPGIFNTAKKPYPPETPFLFVDDLEENVRGAEREGIEGLVFRGYDHFVSTAGKHPVFGPPIRRAASSAGEDASHE